MPRWRRPSDGALAAAAMFCCGWGGNQFTPLLEMYRADNGLSEVVVDALLAAYVLGLAPALLVGSGLSDRHGRKRAMIVALVACLLGSVSLSLHDLPSLVVGRLLSGIGIGLAMAVGTTWVVELGARSGLSAAPSARRASLALTAGLGVGPGVAGLLAQFGPRPEALPYWVHAAVTLPVLAGVVLAGHETSTNRSGLAVARPFRPQAITHPRFRRLLLPSAPWIFGAAGIAYATVPAALHPEVRHWALLYATILTVAAMASGFAVQPLAHRLDHPVRPRSLRVAMATMIGGMALAAAAVMLGSPGLGLLTALVLGAALGLTLVSGLLEVQRLTEPAELARVTGIFYALAYIGFLAPMFIALSGETPNALWLLTALALGCTAFISLRRPHPGRSWTTRPPAPVATGAPPGDA